MDAIEKIIAQIDEQAAAERAAYEETEKSRIDQEFSTKLASLKEQKEKQLTKQLDAIDKKYRQLKNRQQVEIRQETLNQKQRFLAQLFQSAAEKMSQWTVKEHQAFAQSALENLALNGEMTFISGELSAEAYSDNWISVVNQVLPYTLQRSAEVISGKAGFILDDQGVQYNFIYDNLVQDQQQTMSYELAKELFG